MSGPAITVPLFAIRHRRIGGVESAIYNLTKGLAEAGADLAVARTRAEYLAPEYAAWLATAPVRTTYHRSFGRRLAARFAEESWFGLARTRGHVVYPNYFLPPVRRQSGRAAVLIHDFQHRVFPDYFTTAKRRWLDLHYARALRAADRLLFISEFERDQAQRLFPEACTAPAHVIYNAIDIQRYQGAPSPGIAALAERPFLLSVAHQHAHKNVETLVHAFARFAGSAADMRLVLAGVPSASVRAAIEALPPPVRDRIHLTGFIADADLGHLYRSTRLFVLPSRYEGFGMPAVEALAHGRPALLADAGALREVTLGLAAYLPADASAESWAAAIGDVVDRPGLGAEAIGILLARYAPATVAGRVVAALEEA